MQKFNINLVKAQGAEATLLSKNITTRGFNPLHPNLVKSFLIAFIRFAKNKFEIVNRCHYEDEVRSNTLYLDCHAYARNDNKFKKNFI